MKCFQKYFDGTNVAFSTRSWLAKAYRRTRSFQPFRCAVILSLGGEAWSSSGFYKHFYNLDPCRTSLNCSLKIVLVFEIISLSRCIHRERDSTFGHQIYSEFSRVNIILEIAHFRKNDKWKKLWMRRQFNLVTAFNYPTVSFSFSSSWRLISDENFLPWNFFIDALRKALTSCWLLNIW